MQRLSYANAIFGVWFGVCSRLIPQQLMLQYGKSVVVGRRPIHPHVEIPGSEFLIEIPHVADDVGVGRVGRVKARFQLLFAKKRIPTIPTRLRCLRPVFGIHIFDPG